ncbi:MAG: tRNA dihydrouridine synthase DusB [Lachnospiraceae bacterium]|nr:tRNA dihydrouridine synthase DusB [Lachnospiraceae bacterium]
MHYIHELQIGNVTTPNNVWLGPMAGVTDLPFRLLCHELGAGCVSTEMVSAKAITYRNEKTWDLMKTDENEHPVALQLFGSEPEIMARAKEMIADVAYDILDINMGCPMPKIVNNGEGSALMKNPRLIEELVRSVAGESAGTGTLTHFSPSGEQPETLAEKRVSVPVPLTHPITVKLRSGFDDAHINAVECALAAQAGGASAVTIHARTREQYYTGSADYSVIRAVKEALRIPVIGSGDVTDASSAILMFEETGCDGIMIARAAQGNPWIFREIITYLATGKMPKRPDDAEILSLVLRHARMLTALKGEYIAVREMRKHLAWYTTGRKGSAKLRGQLSAITDMETLERMCLSIFDKSG